jgi:hypothetical protein
MSRFEVGICRIQSRSADHYTWTLGTCSLPPSVRLSSWVYRRCCSLWCLLTLDSTVDCLFHVCSGLPPHFKLAPGIAQWYSAGLRYGWSGDQVPAGAGNFSLHQCVQTGSAPPPTSLLPKEYQGHFSWVWGGRGVNLTTHLHLTPRLCIRATIPPLTQYAFMAWCSVKAQGQLYLHFTFTTLKI